MPENKEYFEILSDDIKHNFRVDESDSIRYTSFYFDNFLEYDPKIWEDLLECIKHNITWGYPSIINAEGVVKDFYTIWAREDK